VLCLRYPELLTVPEAHALYDVGLIRLALHVVLIAGFALGVLSIVLRKEKVLGFTALACILTAVVLGGSRAQNRLELESDVYLGLDWFLLNLIFTGALFVPIERLLGRKEQDVFRYEWREDLLYFLISSLFVQVLTLLSLAPSLGDFENIPSGRFPPRRRKPTDRLAILRNHVSDRPRAILGPSPVSSNSLALELPRDPSLGANHDWLTSSRMHVVEIVLLRGLTVVPMYVLGFSEPALYAYFIFVYFLSAMVHSNLRVGFGWLDRFS